MLVEGAAAVAGAVVATSVMVRAKEARADAGDDITTLNALLSAEYNAIKAYSAGAGIIGAAPSSDPFFAAKSVVTAVAVHFQQQHKDHAVKLDATIKALGGTPVAEDSVTFTAPAGLKPTIQSVLELAANAEKNASIAYCDVLKTITASENAELIAAVGAVETQHFIVLSLILQSIVAPTATTESGVADVVPTAFAVTLGSDKGLETVPDFTFA